MSSNPRTPHHPLQVAGQRGNSPFALLAQRFASRHKKMARSRFKLATSELPEALRLASRKELVLDRFELELETSALLVRQCANIWTIPNFALPATKPVSIL